MIDNVIYMILAAASGITAIVGTNIFTAVAAEGDYDQYIVIHLIDMVPENTKDGASMLDEIRIQVDSYNSDKDSGDQLAVIIRNTLDRYRGTVQATYVIDNILFDNARNDFDEDRGVYKVSQDFIVRHKKSRTQ